MYLNEYVQDELNRVMRNSREEEARLFRLLRQFKQEQRRQAARPSGNKNPVLGKGGN